MEEQKLLDLIDRYLLGTISPGDKAYLEQLMAFDPAIAEQVRESRQAYNILLAEQHRRLRERLKQIDRDDKRNYSALLKWIKIMLLLLVVLVMTLYWISEYYSPVSIATRYADMHKATGEDVFLHHDHDNYFDLANQAFMDESFEKAISLYSSWLHQIEPGTDETAQWNLLLARFASQGITPEWKQEMELFSDQAREPLKSQSKKLLRLLNSPIYRLFCIRLQSNLTSLKPHLM